ncbi:MAG: hypothetical protein H0X24_02825 [Ktedonobacterales bacterium]|nr:hypothetical protein [Ktedonobacterales bacterium]
MAAPTPTRPKASGGTPLIILGIVLAVIAAILVLFLTTGGGGVVSAGNTVNVVMAAQSLSPGTVLAKDGTASGYVRVADAFHVERLPPAAVPSDAYAFTSTDALATALDNQIVQSPFLAGDILRTQDNRMAKIGSSAVKSVVNHKPSSLQAGQVLFALHASGDLQIGLQEGDHIDLLATECVQANAKASGCQVAQTTLQDLSIYMVANGLIFVAVSHQDALILKILVETAKLNVVLRKPGDDGHVTTQPVDAGSIISRFGFTAP